MDYKFFHYNHLRQDYANFDDGHNPCFQMPPEHHVFRMSPMHIRNKRYRKNSQFYTHHDTLYKKPVKLKLSNPKEMLELELLRKKNDKNQS